MKITLLEFSFLLFFAVMNIWYALSLITTAYALSQNLRRSQPIRYKALLTLDAYRPISLLVPAYNEEQTIKASIDSLLKLSYPQFEIVIVCDGCTDRTLEVLQESYHLSPVREVVPMTIRTQAVRAVYGSVEHPTIRVIDKDNGGKADALNVALQYARYPLFCALDADSLLDSEALVRVARRFADSDKLLAVGGTVRPLNGATLRNDEVVDLQMPQTHVERFQIVEYIRAFLTGRTALSAFGLLLIVSGAFGLFRRDAVLRVGGYRADTVGEDMELIVRLHRDARERRLPYSIEYIIDPICWTQVPDTWRVLQRQRDRWQRGLLETLWLHKRMFLNPRYGRIGLLAMPFYVFFEALAPVIELGGYVLMVLLLLSGQYSLAFVLLFLLLAVGYGMLISVSAQSIEVFLRQRLSRRRDRSLLLLYAFLDNVGYRQWTLLIRFWATLTVPFRAGQWGKQERRKIESMPSSTPMEADGEAIVPNSRT